MSFFKELLAIKTFREGKAERHVRKQKQVLAEAVAQRLAREAALVEYRSFAQKQEVALFNDLCSRLVNLSAIEDVQHEVAHMRAQEQQRQMAVQEAEKKKLLEEQCLLTLRDAHKEAQRAQQKFTEFAQVYADERLKELERKEDAEMEEVAELRRDRTDWEENHEESRT
jgi:type III secretion protein O